MTAFRLPILAFVLLAAGSPAFAAEQPVDPYVVSDANAGTTPIQGDAVYKAFHGREGVARIVSDLVDRNVDDPRISDIFKAADLERLKRTLTEQFCYILGGPVSYTGRDMTAAHKDQGLQTSDFNFLVENLQWAMDKEGVPFRDQNRLLAKLAPMKRAMVER